MVFGYGLRLKFNYSVERCGIIVWIKAKVEG
jgi:hypothetical protein